MASSSSNQYVTVGVEEECYYPYPSNLSATSFISVKVSDREEYDMWKTQMECLLRSHGMYGFIDGTFISPETSSRVSGKEKVGDDRNQSLWTRSDAVVKGWILGSLSKQTLGYVLNQFTKKPDQVRNADGFSAKDVWDKLETIYGPAVPPPTSGSVVAPQVVVPDSDKQKEGKRLETLGKFYKDVVRNDADYLDKWSFLSHWAIEKIMDNGNSGLHVAVSHTDKPGILEKLLALVPENTQLSDVRNSDGSTPLHVAAIVGNTKAARILVERDSALLFAKDKEAGTSADELVVTAISSKNFSLAEDLMQNTYKYESDAMLMAIAQNYPSKALHGILSRLESAADYIYIGTTDRCVPLCGSWVAIVIRFCMVIFARLLLIPIRILVWLLNMESLDDYFDSRSLLHAACEKILWYNPITFPKYYTDPIFEATRQNSYEVVEKLVHYFPKSNWEHQRRWTMKDRFDNNLLHLAARLAPTNKLNLISGAALKTQRELQWFKEVERFVCPLCIIQKNSFGETPQMVFTREHKDLVIEGEKWTKATAESYTITAALITTIVFAAAITVPGGNNQETGLPVFTNHVAFTIFAISDAISLFGAVTSLLMFLSILTARFAEQDFLFKLPTKLIIGLATLFISTAAMIVAFGATLYLVFSQGNSRILIPIVVLTCLPIISFVTLQFPLIKDLISATYGFSIFGKQSDVPFY